MAFSRYIQLSSQYRPQYICVRYAYIIVVVVSQWLPLGVFNPFGELLNTDHNTFVLVEDI